jgi:hypothetical protein
MIGSTTTETNTMIRQLNRCDQGIFWESGRG